MNYACSIIYGGQPVFNDGTTAISTKKAEMNTWYKYMKKTGYPGVVPIFMKNKIDQGYSCRCAPVPEQPPNKQQKKTERYQPNLFEKQLDAVLGIYNICEDDI